jgi:hypothetical protein
MPLGYIKEATYQFSHLYPSGNGQTPGFYRASSKESKRMLEVPERSLGGF